MAINVSNTNYSGEVLEQLLTLAATGNEIVDKGLMMVIPNVTKKISIPRIKTGKMLQKVNNNPTLENSKGDFTYSEQVLEPHKFMAFTTFDPAAFENIWRPFQPTGNLVFRELPANIQNKLLEELSKQVTFELGDHYINGEYGDGADQLMNGILPQAAKATDYVLATTTETTMLGKMKALRLKIPLTMIGNPKLRILMSYSDWMTYDDELTAKENKNVNDTTLNPKKYKDITIETLAKWPDGLIVATLCSPDTNGNLFAAVNLSSDEDVIQIDKLTNASDLYFFKMKMEADTNIGFGEEFVVLDSRGGSATFKAA